MREDIRLELAPMEGLTGYVFRNALVRFFPGPDTCYTPFLVVNQHHSFKTREKREIDPKNQKGVFPAGSPRLVPQLMANDPDLFLWGCQYLEDLGYEEVNLNAGCPSPTVVTKGKGSGMLADTLKLERFLDRVFEDLGRSGRRVRVSVKSRLGMDDPGEMEDLIQIYNAYPLERLIIHARVGRTAYRGNPDRDAFFLALEGNRLPISYNGDILKPQDGDEVLAAAARHDPDRRLDGLMIGRGLLRNPALFRKMRGGPPAGPAELEEFTGDLFHSYAREMDGYGNALFRMKEVWTYLKDRYTDGDRYLKAIQRSRRREDYEQAVRALCRYGQVRED